jgi:hypothetical protein
MRLGRSIACDRAPLNRNRNAANLGQDVERNKETHEPRTDCGLSLQRFLQPVSGCMNVVSVEVIEDFEVQFNARSEAFVGLESRELPMLLVPSAVDLLVFPSFNCLGSLPISDLRPCASGVRFLTITRPPLASPISGGVCSIRPATWMLVTI